MQVVYRKLKIVYMKNTTNVRIPKKKCFKMSLETVDRRRMSSRSEFHRKGPALTKARSPDVFPRVYGTSKRPCISDLNE